MPGVEQLILELLEQGPMPSSRIVEVLAERGVDPREARRALARLVKEGLVEKKPSYGDRAFLFSRNE